MPGTSLGVGGSLARRPVRALMAAALAVVGVVVVATWFNDRNPTVSSSTFEQPVTVEAVIVDEGRTTQGGNTVCGPTYRFELDGQQIEVVAPVPWASLCASEGTTRRVTVDAANPRRVVDPVLEHDRSTSVVLAVGVVVVVLLAATLIRWRDRPAGDGDADPGTSGRQGPSSGSSRRRRA